MSFILAWKYQDELFCIADTAITHYRDPKESISSFGEKQEEQIDGNTVEEGIVKIIPISDAAAVAFVGTVLYANRYITKLKAVIGSAPVADLLIRIAQEEPIPHGFSLGLIILSNSEGGEPELVLWDSSVPDTPVINHEYGAMGSLVGSPYASFVVELLNYFTEHNLDADRLFITMQGVMQWLIVHTVLMVHGVGGAVFGARIGQSGFRWQEDVTYIYLSTRFIRAYVGWEN